MNPTQQLIERVRSMLPRKSDYAVAKAVGIASGRMSGYVNGHHHLSEDEVIVRAAKVIGDDPALLVAHFHRVSARSDDAKAAWLRLERLAKRAAGQRATPALETA